MMRLCIPRLARASTRPLYSHPLSVYFARNPACSFTECAPSAPKATPPTTEQQKDRNCTEQRAERSGDWDHSFSRFHRDVESAIEDVFHGAHPFGRRLFGPFTSLLREFDTSAGGDAAARETKSWRPRLNVNEEEKALTIQVEMPGLSKEDLTVDISEGILTLKGERKSSPGEKATRSYLRKFTLPDDVDVTQVKAKMEHGLLEITIPKREAQKVSVSIN